jgi:hypothetical protein
MKTTSVKTVGGKHTVSEDIDQSCTGNNFGSVECSGVNQISCNHTNDCSILNTRNVVCESGKDDSLETTCKPIFRECNDDKDCLGKQNLNEEIEFCEAATGRDKNIMNFEKVCRWGGG